MSEGVLGSFPQIPQIPQLDFVRKTTEIAGQKERKKTPPACGRPLDCFVPRNDVGGVGTARED